MFFLLRTFKFMLLCGLVVTIYLPYNSCQNAGVGWFWIWVVFLLQFAIHPFSTNWQSAGVSECSCSKYRFLQQPGICAVCLFRICAVCRFTKSLDIFYYRQPGCRQESTQEMLMFISSLQRGCQPCFSFAERNNLRLFFPSSSCFSCSAAKLSLLRNFSGWEHAYSLLRQLFVF